MRVRKIVSPPSNHHPKTHLVKSPRRRKLQDVRSLETLPQASARPDPTPRHRPHLVAQQSYPTDQDRKQRQTMQYIPVRQQNSPQPVMVQEWGQYRSQRNTAQVAPKRRDPNIVNRESARNSHQNSQRRIKIFSAEPKDKSLSGSERSNSKRKAGIEVTKTLLKRISDMYTEKDFQNRSGSCSHKEESTGLTLNASGRGVADEYQLNDSDLPPMANHTVTVSYSNNPLSFNDSGSWNEQSLQKIVSQPPPQAQPILIRQQATPSPVKRISRPTRTTLLSQGRTSESIMVGPQPPSRGSLMRRDGRGFSPNSDSDRYVINSKDKTMSQLSLKQSIVQYDYNYYR